MKTSILSIFRKRQFREIRAIRPNISWLIILPLSVMIIANVYVPILGGSVTAIQVWLVTSLIILFMAISLVGHVLAHQIAAQMFKIGNPEIISVFLFGEPAQVWPVSSSSWQDMMAALAGPIFNLLFSGLTYFIWNAQLNWYLNLSMPLIALFNLWLAVINLAPVFPFDGGRLFNAFVFRFSEGNSSDFRMVVWLGFLSALAECAWGIFLIAQNARYSLETGLATIFLALLAAFGLVTQPAKNQERPNSGRYTPMIQWLGTLMSGLFFLLLTAIATSLLMTNYGIEAPGIALSVEPMVEIPAEYRHPHQAAGTFLLTSVIQQSPIPAGMWVAGQLSTAFKILPPEKRAPNQVSPQENARQGFQMLDQSVTTASVVGLRLAGYPATQVGKGAGVASILPESPAQGILLPGDIIIGVNGEPVHTAADLINKIKSLDPQARVHLKISRNQAVEELELSLLPPAKPGDPPRIGISVQDAGFDTSLPIAVKIVPQKIVGGPSAGLMFTLTLYNLLTPVDLTGGRRIAGTGTINPDGTVGPIGGVEQKVAAAEATGAEYFLSPAENYADATTAARQIKVIKVATAEEAITFLRSLPAK